VYAHRCPSVHVPLLVLACRLRHVQPDLAAGNHSRVGARASLASQQEQRTYVVSVWRANMHGLRSGGTGKESQFTRLQAACIVPGQP